MVLIGGITNLSQGEYPICCKGVETWRDGSNGLDIQVRDPLNLGHIILTLWSPLGKPFGDHYVCPCNRNAKKNNTFMEVDEAGNITFRNDRVSCGSNCGSNPRECGLDLYTVVDP